MAANGDNRLIPYVMAIGVVDSLKVVHIDQQQGRHPLVASAALKLIAQQYFPVPPVIEAGHAVAGAHNAQALLLPGEAGEGTKAYPGKQRRIEQDKRQAKPPLQRRAGEGYRRAGKLEHHQARAQQQDDANTKQPRPAHAHQHQANHHHQHR